MVAIVWFGLICAAFGTVTSIMNILQHKGFVTVTTILYAIAGILDVVAVRVLHSRRMVVILAVIVSALTFSYYAISGTNEGFAILWTMLMPLAICYFIGVKQGIMLSVYFEALILRSCRRLSIA